MKIIVNKTKPNTHTHTPRKRLFWDATNKKEKKQALDFNARDELFTQ
jgi:hypothetical protein